MANGTFFISWQLWEEMTFVLAMGIVIVFLVGLVKLWWTNRHMRRIEELDAEKQARTVQVRKSGLPAQAGVSAGRFGGEIPFGIKAIESGVEVEGIWIARMASMASRPPDRKWSSKRKVRTPAAPAFLEMNDLTSSPSKRVRRGSSRAGRISRREILGSSSQTRGKFESLSLLEEEPISRDTPDREGSHEQYVANGQPSNLAAQGRMPQPGHKGPLGRIQRSLKKKVTSTETRDKHAKNSHLGGEGVREFREQAEARKPQRFYPGKSTTPLVGPASRDQVARPRANGLPSKDELGQAWGQAGTTRDRSGQYPPGQSTSAPQRHDPHRRASSNSTSSSLETFVTTSELPKDFVPAWQPPPLENHPALADGDGTSLQGQRDGPRRPLRSARHLTHGSSSADNSSLHDAHDTAQSTPQMATAAQRYPPNSSRSASVAYSRPQPFTQHHQQQSASSSTQHSPALGPSDSYINVTKRKVNSNFEVLPAGTFGGYSEQAYDALPTREPSIAADSVRSSFDSQGSGGTKKSRNRLRKKSISSQYSR